MRDLTNGIPERQVRSGRRGTSACLVVAIGLVSLFLSGRLHADMGAIHEKPALEPAASVALPSCEAADFRILEKRIKIVGNAGAEGAYTLIDSKLTPVT